MGPFGVQRLGRQAFHGAMFDFLADQILDGGNEFLVAPPDQGDGMAGAPGPARAPDAMHIIVGLEGNIEVEDVTDRGNVEAARGDIARYQKPNLAVAEGIECFCPYGLIEVAMQRSGGKIVLL